MQTHRKPDAGNRVHQIMSRTHLFTFTLAMLAQLACGPAQTAHAPAAAPTPTPTAEAAAAAPDDAMHTLPWGLAPGAYLKGLESAPRRAGTVAEARAGIAPLTGQAATRRQIRRWHFYQFNKTQLIFLLTRYEPNPQKGVLPGGWYVVDEVVTVPRSERAVEQLLLRKDIDRYEIGMAGIKAGMGPGEVEKILGAPSTVLQLGPFGAFDYLYRNLRVRFLQNRVAFAQSIER